MVNMSHHSDDRRSWLKVFRLVNRFRTADLLRDIRSYELHLISELFCHKHQRLRIQSLIDGHHKSEAHARTDNLDNRSIIHERSKIVHRHKLSHFKDLLLRISLCKLLLCLLSRSFTLLLTIFGTEIILLAFIHLGVRLLDLLLDFLLHFLLLGFCHRRLETVTVAFAALSRVLRIVRLSSVLPCFLILTGLSALLLVLLPVLLLRLFNMRTGFDHIHLLRTLGYTFAFFGRFTVKLAEVNLSNHFELSAGNLLRRLYFYSFFHLHGLWLHLFSRCYFYFGRFKRYFPIFWLTG